LNKKLYNWQTPDFKLCITIGLCHIGLGLEPRSVKWNKTRRIGAIFACFYVARVWQRQLGFLVDYCWRFGFDWSLRRNRRSPPSFGANRLS